MPENSLGKRQSCLRENRADAVNIGIGVESVFGVAGAELRKILRRDKRFAAGSHAVAEGGWLALERIQCMMGVCRGRCGRNWLIP